MRKELDKFKVIIEQINSPTEFWLQIPNTNGLTNLCAAQNQNVYRKTAAIKDHNQYLLRDNGTVFAWKCHLAFIAPTNSTTWSLSANDKFIEYTKGFDELAISIPCLAAATSISTAVILWGLRKRCRMNALEGTAADDWENLHLMLIFQGVARSITDIEIIQHFARVPMDFVECPSVQLTDDKVVQYENQAKYSDWRWLPPEPCINKEFIGTPVFIDNHMGIFVQEPGHQKRIADMTHEIKMKYSKCEKSLVTNWKQGEMCITDGNYCRAEIRAVHRREQTCLVYYVDFGIEDTIEFRNMWRCTMFKNVPIQVRKCHLQKVAIPIRMGKLCPSRAVHKFTIDMIRGQCCSFYIHDNLDSTRIDSIPCTVQPLNDPLDLASELISYHMVGITSNFMRETKFDEDKRKRNERDNRVLMPSTELETLDDFKWFYESKKVIIPAQKTTNSSEDNRKFDVFAPLQETISWETNKSKTKIENHIEYKPHPLIDKVTKYFRLSTPNESQFDCYPLFVIDPITILVVPINATPTPIDIDTTPPTDPLLPESAPCIAYLGKKWRRGIVLETVSATDEYTILCADTLKSFQVNRDFVQACPPDLLNTKLDYIKVRFSNIIPNPRTRPHDVCQQLSKALLNKNLCLFARIVGVHNDAVPEIKLYYDEKCIYAELIEQKLYKNV